MKLIEVLSSAPDFQLVRVAPHNFATRMIISGRKIVFMASQFDETDDEPWTVIFTETALDQYGREKGDARLDKTGSGGEFKVFAFVAASLREFIRRYDPHHVSFSASIKDGSSRISIYRRLGNKLLKGYRVSETTTNDAHHLDFVKS